MACRNDVRNCAKSFLLFFIWILPGILLSNKNYADSFMYIRIGRAYNAMQTGKISAIEYSSSFELIRTGYDILLSIILSVTSIPPLELLYIPIGSIIIPAMYYCTVKSISKSTKIAVYSSIYIAYLHALITVQYNSFIYVWTHILVLVFVILLNKYDMSHKTQYPLLILVVFISNFSIYHSSTAWLLFMFLAYTGLRLLINFKSKRFDQNISLALALFVFYISFESYIYTRLLPRVVTTKILNPFDEGKLLFLSIFSKSTSYAQPYQIIPKTSLISSLCTLIVIFLLVTPFILLIIKVITSNKSIHDMISDFLRPKMVLVYSVACVPIFHLLAYYIYSGFSLSLRPMFLLFPIVIYLIFPYLIRKKSSLDNIKLIDIYSIILIIVVVVGFFSFNMTIENYDSASSFNDISKFVIGAGLDTKSNVVVADLFVHGRLALNLVINGAETPSLLPFNSEIYSYLLNENYKNIDFDYLVLNKENYKIPITGWGWEQYIPLESYDNELTANKELIKIYSDGSSSIMLKKYTKN